MALRKAACKAFDELVAALPEARASLRRVSYGGNATYEDLVLYKLHRLQAQLHTICITSDDACSEVGVRASKLDHETRECLLWLLDALNDFMLADYVRLASKIHEPHLPPRSWKGWKPTHVPPRGVIVTEPVNVNVGDTEGGSPLGGAGDVATFERSEASTAASGSPHSLGMGQHPLHPHSTSVKVSQTLLKVTRQRSLTADGSTLRREPKKLSKRAVSIRERPLDVLLSKFAHLEERSRDGWLTPTRPDSVIPFVKADGESPSSKSLQGSALVTSSARKHKGPVGNAVKGVECSESGGVSPGSTAGTPTRVSKEVTFVAAGAGASHSRARKSGLGPAPPRTTVEATAAMAAATMETVTLTAQVADLPPEAAAESAMRAQHLAHHFRSPTPQYDSSPVQPLVVDTAESEIDEDEAGSSTPHRAYNEAAFALSIPKSANVWRQLWNSSIELQHCQLGSKGIRALAGALRCEGARCSYLGLMGTGMDAAALTDVLDAISCNPGLGLTQFNLGCNQLGVGGGAALAEFCEEAKAAAKEGMAEGMKATAQDLNMVPRSAAAPQPAEAEEGEDAVAEMTVLATGEDEVVADVSSVNGVSGVGGDIVAADTAAIAVSWEVVTGPKPRWRQGGLQLQAISVHNCGLTDTAMATVLRSLEHHPSVTAVDLSRNGGAQQAAAAISALLRSQHGVMVCVDASWNRMTAANVCPIAEALAVNTTLQELDLSWNGLGSEGVAALGDALGRNVTLRQLHMGSCGAGPSAAKRLANGLNLNCGSLEVLTLQNNPLGQKGGEAVAAVVNAKHLDAMPSVNLIGCHFHPIKEEAEKAALQGTKGAINAESDFNIAVKGDLIGLSEEMLMRPLPDDDTFEYHLEELDDPSVTDRERLQMLRRYLGEYRYTSRQCKAALASFHKPGESRAQCAVLMLPHIPQTFWSLVDALLSREESRELQSRITRLKGDARGGTVPAGSAKGFAQ